MNLVIEKGRLTESPNLKTTTSGKSVLSFCIAVPRAYQQGGERKTDFLDCVAWEKRAEFISRNFGKGEEIIITGELQTRSYEDNNGNKRKAVEIVVEKAEFSGSKKSEGNTPDVPNFEEIDQNDDLPF